MKIVLTGVETNNKGAELMFYAILQEIERKYPEAEVFIEPDAVSQGLAYVKTRVVLRYWPYAGFVKKTRLESIFRRLHIPIKMLKDTRAVAADYVFDGSGFCFSDQCKMWGRMADWWDSFLKRQYKHGAKIVFLPQAFGPIEMIETKEAIRVLNKYATCIMPRERVSYEYLKKSNLVDMQKVKTYLDFTSLGEGKFPIAFEHLKNGICVIPNKQMIEQGKISQDKYLALLSAIIAEGKKSGHPVYLLNHEGKKDEWLANQCRKSLNNSIEVVSGISALEVKGLIDSAYLVVTSRFHGLASALNSCVPSVATSWSHKYSELFKDYDMNDYVLPLNDEEEAIKMLTQLCDESKNSEVRAHLKIKNKQIKENARAMWNYIWAL